MGALRCSPVALQLRLLLLGGILVPVLGSVRALCRSDDGDGCDPMLAFLDRGDASFWSTEYGTTWRHFELPARVKAVGRRTRATTTGRAGKIEAELDALAGSL